MRRKIEGPFASNVLYLGLTSLLTDISSEMIFNLLPLFLLNVLHASLPQIGLIEGVAGGAAAIVPVLSGRASDKLRKRKALALLGYGISTALKPLLLLAGGWGEVLGIRAGERGGKGIRTPPRDALLAASVAGAERGRGFGFHRALDTLGAAAGICIAAGLVFLLQRGEIELAASTFRVVVVAGVIPAAAAVAILAAKVREVPFSPSPAPSGRKAAPGFGKFLVAVGFFGLANFSAAFLILRAQIAGYPAFSTLLLLALSAGIYAALSTSAGALSDRWSRKGVVGVGWGIYIASALLFAFAPSPLLLLPAFALYGLFQAFCEGPLRALVADFVGREKRGEAYGIFAGVTGGTALLGNFIAGALWSEAGFRASFLFGALTMSAALAALSKIPSPQGEED